MGGLFVAAGLAIPREYKVPCRSDGQGSKHGKYKNGIKRRMDITCPYTRHDMRRAFNAEAEKAGMDLKERCAILGHTPSVNKKALRR